MELEPGTYAQYETDGSILITIQVSIDTTGLKIFKCVWKKWVFLNKLKTVGPTTNL